MNISRIIALLATQVVFALALSGCFPSNIYYAPTDACAQPLDPSMARIVLRRETAIGGSGLRWRIIDSSQPIGELANGQQLCWDRYPGKAVLGAAESKNKLILDTVAGSTYHVVASLDWGGASFEVENPE